MKSVLRNIVFVFGICAVASCGHPAADQPQIVSAADSTTAGPARGTSLLGKWEVRRKRKGSTEFYMVFRQNGKLSLTGPDSEFERLRYRTTSSDRLHIKREKKSEDSRWTFADTVFLIERTGENEVRIKGARQSYLLTKL